MKAKIKLKGEKEVAHFVEIASKCEFDIDVQYRHFFLDGKSLVGMMSIDSDQLLTIYYNGMNPVFENMLKQYEI